ACRGRRLDSPAWAESKPRCAVFFAPVPRAPAGTPAAGVSAAAGVRPLLSCRPLDPVEDQPREDQGTVDGRPEGYRLEVRILPSTLYAPPPHPLVPPPPLRVGETCGQIASPAGRWRAARRMVNWAHAPVAAPAQRTTYASLHRLPRHR